MISGLNDTFQHTIIHVAGSGDLKQRGPLWYPSWPCPVAGCSAVIHSNKYLRHWREKHEPLIRRFKCVECAWTTTRQDFGLTHMKSKHDYQNPDLHSCLIAEVSENRRFIDPGPLTLNNVLGYT